MERERIYKRLKEGQETWKEFFYYGLHDLIEKEAIFSKLPYLLGHRIKINHFDSQSNFLKNVFTIPTLFFWRLFLIGFERKYYKIKYPHVSALQDILNESFDYLFVLNTRDHTIIALPVLESMDNDKAKCLVVTFKGVYTKYKNDFDNLKNAKVIFFEYGLKNLPLMKYLRIIKESKNKFRLLESQNLDSDLKRLIKLDKNFIKFHLKTELVQYYFFENVFNAFDIKGAVSIVFTTAFELCEEQGIPTFVLQHGLGGKWHGHPYVSDYWFTLDDVSKDSLDEWLDHTVNVLTLGSPRYEYLAKMSKNQKSKNFNTKIGKSGYKKIVTYIGGIDENQLTFQALKDLRKALPEYVNLIIKMHPRVPLKTLNLKKELQKILTQKELKQTTFIRGEIDFYEILANSDVVITIASTGMVEAIAADIPTIQVNFTDLPIPKQNNLSSFGWKEPINDPDVMINETLSILSDTKRYEEVIKKQKWLKNRMFKNFGNCGKVIAETIINICNEKRKTRDKE